MLLFTRQVKFFVKAERVNEFLDSFENDGKGTGVFQAGNSFQHSQVENLDPLSGKVCQTIRVSRTIIDT